MSTIRILALGGGIGVQDLGRGGWQDQGVPIGGALDRFAAEAANLLVGNPGDAALLEVVGGGATVETGGALQVALTGGDLGATSLAGDPAPRWATFRLRPGARLQFSGRQGSWGARAYLAVAGGLALPPVLGSRSLISGGGFGGLDGRPLRAGDTLPVGVPPIDPARLDGREWPDLARPAYRAAPTLRLLPGPHLDCFGPAALDLLCTSSWEIAPTSNRMGYRLRGPRLPVAPDITLPSLGVVPGTIQVPPDGQPILLLADAQPTGGYPILAVAIAPDLPLAAQLFPGDTLAFGPCPEAEALRARQTEAAWLRPQWEEDDGSALAAAQGAAA